METVGKKEVYWQTTTTLVCTYDDIKWTAGLNWYQVVSNPETWKHFKDAYMLKE